MAGTLASLVNCCSPCEDPTSVAVPGPAGDDGTNGTNGTNGVNAYTTFTAAFTMPAELGSAVATVATTAPFAVNQILYGARVDGSKKGYLLVTAIGGATSITLKNLRDTATGAYLSNDVSPDTLSIGSQLQAGGLQGPAGLVASTAIAGDVTGTLAASTLTIAGALGSLPVGNGTKAIALAKGTDGHALIADAAAALDLTYKAIVPITGDSDLDTDRVARLSAATGLPIPLKSSRASIKDAGGAGTFVLDARTAVANARGADAFDGQTSRNAVTQVASSARSVLVGGDKNTVVGVEAAIVGGDSNSTSADRAVVVGGQSNTGSGQESFIGGGQLNVAGPGTQSVVAGGDSNTASGTESAVGGGNTNIASATQSTVAGGSNNSATATGAAVGGGVLNVASGLYSGVPCGAGNRASANYASATGADALADKQGQVAHAAGYFAAQGDAQDSTIRAKRSTANATPVELFLDGNTAAQRITVPTGASWMFQIMLTARKDDGLTSIYKSEGLITNVAGTVTCPAAPTTTEIFDGIGLPATPVVVTADDPNNSLAITCTGIAATNIRWNARITIVEVTY